MMEVMEGGSYVAEGVKERIAMRSELPEPAREITDRRLEVARLICSGYTDVETADSLHISKSTVDIHRAEIYRSLNVRNSVELLLTALYIGLVKPEELYFRPKAYELKPRPKKQWRENDNKSNKR